MSKFDILKNKEWLEEQYVKKGKTDYQIAKELGVSRSAVYNWRHKHGIEAIR
jgi:transposase